MGTFLRLATVNESALNATAQTHEPIVFALMSVFIVCQLGCISLLIGFCYLGQFTLSFTACCLSGGIIRVGYKPSSGPVDVEEAVAEQLKKESFKANSAEGAKSNKKSTKK